jgi:hypothetical protein
MRTTSTSRAYAAWALVCMMDKAPCRSHPGTPRYRWYRNVTTSQHRIRVENCQSFATSAQTVNALLVQIAGELTKRSSEEGIWCAFPLVAGGPPCYARLAVYLFAVAGLCAHSRIGCSSLQPEHLHVPDDAATGAVEPACTASAVVTWVTSP